MTKIAELLLAEMEREAAGTRRALERVPEGCFNHIAHHRGQLTVYLRLNDIPVPSLYGPTADEKTF